MLRYCHNPLPRHDVERRNSHSNPLCCSTVRFDNNNPPQRSRQIQSTRRWRTSSRFFAYFGTRAKRAFLIFLFCLRLSLLRNLSRIIRRFSKRHARQISRVQISRVTLYLQAIYNSKVSLKGRRNRFGPAIKTVKVSDKVSHNLRSSRS